MIPDYGELVAKKYSYLAVGAMAIMPAEGREFTEKAMIS